MRKSFLAISFITFFLCLLLLSWWGHFFYQSNLLEKEKRMLFYEGSFLFLFFIVIQFILLFFFKKEQKKEKILKYIFSALTHDLKTPLSSLKIQLDFLEKKFDIKVLKRSQEDLKKIEDHLLNTLHLSFIETKFPELEPLNIVDFLPKYNHYVLDIKVSHCKSNPLLLSLIFKNIFSNALKHSNRKNPLIYVSSYQKNFSTYVIIKNEGDVPSSLKEGTGLFLSKELMKLSQGNLTYFLKQPFTIQLTFKNFYSKISS